MNYDIEMPKGKMVGSKFIFPIRIYYEDTDAGGVVYYANYLKFAERARTEYLRALGCNEQQKTLEEEKCAFMVRHVEVDYKAPAVLDDLLSVSCELIEIKGAGAEMKQEIYCGEKLLVSLNIKLAYVSLLKKRPVRIPDMLIEKINSFA